jgi:hypothetical protein
MEEGERGALAPFSFDQYRASRFTFALAFFFILDVVAIPPLCELWICMAH